MNLVERVARLIDKQAGYVDMDDIARDAISEVLDAVEAHLSAVQYDPAPYTALKHRLAQLRKEAE